MKPESYAVDRQTDARVAAISGVLRLGSTAAYERIFQPIRTEMISSGGPYTLDLSKVVFMNSSGIRSLGELVLAAKRSQIPLTIRGDSKSPWQRKTVASLRLLNEQLVFEDA